MSSGYEVSEIAALRDRLEAARSILQGHLSQRPLGELLLVCDCTDCIAPDHYARLVSTPPTELTRVDVNCYFGGAGVLECDTSCETQEEALAIYLHCLDALAEAALADAQVERSFHRAWSFVEPNYWHEPLYATGFVAELGPAVREAVRSFLCDVLRLCIARSSPRSTDCLIYLSRGTEGFEEVVTSLLADRPRRRLAFWAAVAGWSPNSPAGMKNAGVTDFQNQFSFMADVHRRFLEDRLADPATGRLLEKFAFGARDAEWLAYLSRLVAWRENTILRNAQNRNTG